ncbi:hypothetical protein LUZ63_019527 [Rhynchospora breviuscula]|uniref:F-box domain-containing protein n=1 Tax=Rhynchospora breviuscula TaxID=2022672 RepID=A0A9Q0HJ48_9POAL|nr:hypothetical protein LUZ63_019527 [Rhynchospora breviuscula]
MAGADRFSSLPPEVTVSILSRLPFKEAVRTSALARSWRLLWTYLPCLHIGWSGNPLGHTRKGGGPVASSWIERVHHAVSSFPGPLLHFALSQHFSSDQSVLLQRLLDLLLQKGSLETLAFSSHLFNRVRVVIHLPSFHSLKELKLFGCHIVLPTGFQGFERLSTLSLRLVEISNDDLNLLIHVSNSLTTLECLDIVASNDQLFSIRLSLPLLRYLKIFINCYVEKVEVVSAPCLEQASILNYTYSDFGELALATLGILTSVVMVSSLDLGFDVLKSLSLAALPYNFTFPQVRWLKLSVNIRAMNTRIYDAFIWLIQSMPFLKVLNIQLGDYSIDTNRNVDILVRELLSIKKHDGLSCLDQTLKCVRIDTENLKHVMTCMTLVKFFLLNARVLELMKVAYRTGSEVEPSMIEELQKAKATTSSKAKFVMISQRENVTVNV